MHFEPPIPGKESGIRLEYHLSPGNDRERPWTTESDKYAIHITEPVDLGKDVRREN